MTRIYMKEGGGSKIIRTESYKIKDEPTLPQIIIEEAQVDGFICKNIIIPLHNVAMIVDES